MSLNPERWTLKTQEALAAAVALNWPAAGLRVGVAWTGSLSHPKNRARSVPLDLLEETTEPRR